MQGFQSLCFGTEYAIRIFDIGYVGSAPAPNVPIIYENLRKDT